MKTKLNDEGNLIMSVVMDMVKWMFNGCLLLLSIILLVSMCLDLLGVKRIWAEGIHHPIQLDVLFGLVAMGCAVKSFASLFELIFGDSSPKERKPSKAEILINELDDAIKNQEYEKAAKIRDILKRKKIKH